MTLKVRYFLFIGVIHVVIAVLIYQILKEQKLLFILSELLLLASFLLAYQLYRRFVQPLQFIASGVDAIRDEDFTVRYVATGSRELDKLVGVYNDMLDRLRQERTQVREQHFFLEKLIDASDTGILLLDFDRRIVTANPRIRKILNFRAEWLNQPLDQIPHPLLQQIALLKEGSSKVIALPGVERYKCELSHFIHRGFKRPFVLVQELSQELLEAEKQAYGKVIRMMAHEVNNSVGPINSILESTIDYFQEAQREEEVRESLQVAMDRNRRLNQFMQNFAQVVRLPEPHRERYDLRELAGNMVRLMSAEAEARRIALLLNLPPAPVWADIDTRQMEQVLLNILKNALESIEAEGAIRIDLHTSPTRLIVADDGPGIPPEAAGQLFSPFFSTKPTGQGVGLTLVREILLNHGCTFSLKTEEDGWTRFGIEF